MWRLGGRDSDQHKGKEKVRYRVQDNDVRRPDPDDQQSCQRRANDITQGKAQGLHGVGSFQLIPVHEGGNQRRASRQRDHHQAAVDRGEYIHMPDLQQSECMQKGQCGKAQATDQVVHDHDPARREPVEQRARNKPTHQNGGGIGDRQDAQRLWGIGFLEDEPGQGNARQRVADG